jgi:hypothetical protein
MGKSFIIAVQHVNYVPCISIAACVSYIRRDFMLATHDKEKGLI